MLESGSRVLGGTGAKRKQDDVLPVEGGREEGSEPVR